MARATIITVTVKGGSDRRQIELATYLARIARAAADGLWEDVTVEIPALSDMRPRMVQPRKADRG